MLAALPRGRGCYWARARTSTHARTSVGPVHSHNHNHSQIHSAPSGARRQLLAGLLGSAALLVGSAAAGPTRGAVALAATGTGSVMEQVLRDPKWPDKFPFPDSAFSRYDEQVDTTFYSSPRFVYHIDDKAVKALTQYYAQTFPPSGSKDVAILDICSSWVSHFPEGYTAGRVAGLGMNGEELARNKQLTEYSVKDLNQDPKLPYEDNTFDIITNVVSVDYLTKPIEVFKEMHRCLKPGGTAIMSFSNRCFPTKAISVWTQTGDEDHVWIVGSYFHYSVPNGFTDPECKDISPGKGSDPMYVVYASKKA